MNSINKIELRNRLLTSRRNLQPRVRKSLDEKICNKVIERLKTLNPKVIHLYTSIPSLGEINTSKIINWARTNSIQVISTVKDQNKWKMVDISKSDQKFEIIEHPSIDIVILPVVAFDRRLNRLGLGGGYYDRLLSNHPGAKSIGIAYEGLLVPEIPIEPHDKILDEVITDKKIYSHA